MDLKCPICGETNPEQFGICRARKSGRNLYCRSCVNARSNESRRLLKERKAAQKKPITIRLKLTPSQKVSIAIRNGARTQAEMEQATELHQDEICDALAILLLWKHEIRTQVIDGTRMYFINEDRTPARVGFKSGSSLFELARKGFGPVVKGDRKVEKVA